MSCAEKPPEQPSLSFVELRAKFGGNAANEERKNGGMMERRGGKAGEEEEEEERNNLVATKKKIFESSQFDGNSRPHPLLLKPHREAPPPPAAKKKEGQNFAMPSVSSAAPAEAGKKGGENVKNLIERLNKFGPRVFGPDTPSTECFLEYQRKMTLGRLKELEEENDGNDGAEAGEEVTEDEGSDELNEAEYSDLSDAATTEGAAGIGEGGGRRGRGERRPNRRQSSFGTTDAQTRSILMEMQSKGQFKRLQIAGGLPSEVGRMRNSSQKPARKGCASDPPTSMALEMAQMNNCTTTNEGKKNGSSVSLRSANSALKGRRRTTAPGEENGAGNDGASAKTASMASSLSGGSTLEEDGCYGSMLGEMPQIPRYETGDEKENKRLRELHSVALEFLQVQHVYVELLQHIGENYPKYLMECEQRFNRNWLSPVGNTPHVIHRIAGQFQMILNVHKVFLGDFAAKVGKWDSRRPDMAEVFQRKADYLKICNNFLKTKRALTAEFQQCLDDNRELAQATRTFEQGILNGDNGGKRGNGMKGISIVMQLDAVHQNVVRYKLLMERYRKYLPDTLVEANIADEALKKLTAVSNTVNEFLAGADAGEKLLELHRKLQGVFDVFAPGRKLLHEGPLRRQTRKELQWRYLILFTDTLLICRYTGALGGADSFDARYQIPIEKVWLDVEEHEDYELEFVVQSSRKSSAFVAQSKRERDVWVKRISEAKKAAKEEKKRRKRTMANGGGVEHQQAEKETAASSDKNNICNGQNGGNRGSSQFYTADPQQMSCEESPELEERPFGFNLDADGEQKASPSANGIVQQSGVVAAESPRSPLAAQQRRNFDALWIPDNKATKCLMAGCDTRFSVLRRKHHCRQCGWLICNKCIGYAPVRIKQWDRCKVCPQCFQENRNAFEHGTLFPKYMVLSIPNSSQPNGGNSSAPADDANSSQSQQPKFSLNDPNLRVAYDGGARLVAPAELFTAPANGILSKARIPVKEKAEQPLASGKVYLRNRKGVPALRWARLTREFFLQFYEAEFDDQPCENFFIYGYTVGFTETEDGGMVIELSHRNQIQTDRKEDQIVFHVLHSRSAERWLEALKKILEIEEPLEAEEDEEGKEEEDGGEKVMAPSK